MSENKEFLNTTSILRRLKNSTRDKHASESVEREPRQRKRGDTGRRAGSALEGPERQRSYSGKEPEGIELPKGKWKGATLMGFRPEEVDRSDVNKYYSLIPRNPRPDEDIYSYAHITWDRRENSLVYKVVEPVLSEEDQELVTDIKEELEEQLDVNFEKIGRVRAKKYLSDRIDDTLGMMGESLRGERKKAVKYYLVRDLIGLSKIEPLMRDPDVEDISCDGVSVPVHIDHRNPMYGSMNTDIVFENPDFLSSFVKKLAQKSGKSLSVANPMVDGILPDGSGLQATLGADIARRGPNFTIEKFRKKPFTPAELIEFGTADPRTLAYIWMAIENQKSILIYGGRSTGKTGLLNTIALLINPDKKIISIESSPEIRLPQNHWIPEVARSVGDEGDMAGIDVHKLLRESLRQRPDYIIVGEILGDEASVLFQEMATGCPSLSTINSESFGGVFDRLTTEPIGIHPSLLENLDILISMNKRRWKEGRRRNVEKVLEMKSYDSSTGRSEVNRLLERNRKGELEALNPSILLRRIADENGADEGMLRNDLKDRMKVFEWMAEKGIKGLDETNETVEMYEERREELMAKIESSW